MGIVSINPNIYSSVPLRTLQVPNLFRMYDATWVLKKVRILFVELGVDAYILKYLVRIMVQLHCSVQLRIVGHTLEPTHQRIGVNCQIFSY